MTDRASAGRPSGRAGRPPDPFVETAALERLPAFRLIDARPAGSADPVAAAVRAPAEAWASASASEAAFADIAFWAQAIGALGLGADTPAIVFDDGRMTDAARVWFILQYFGANAFILNGGRAALERRERYPGLSPPPAGPSQFHPRPRSGQVGLIDRAGLKAELDGATRVLDARTADEHRGDDLRRNPRGGRLPGARPLSHASLLDGPRVRPAAELRALFAEAGFQPGDPIVTHCDGGGRAAFAAAAASRAGYAGVRAYYLSFADWAQDETCPVVRD